MEEEKPSTSKSNASLTIVVDNIPVTDHTEDGQKLQHEKGKWLPRDKNILDEYVEHFDGAWNQLKVLYKDTANFKQATYVKGIFDKYFVAIKAYLSKHDESKTMGVVNMENLESSYYQECHLYDEYLLNCIENGSETSSSRVATQDRDLLVLNDGFDKKEDSQGSSLSIVTQAQLRAQNLELELYQLRRTHKLNQQLLDITNDQKLLDISVEREKANLIVAAVTDEVGSSRVPLGPDAVAEDNYCSIQSGINRQSSHCKELAANAMSCEAETKIHGRNHRSRDYGDFQSAIDQDAQFRHGLEEAREDPIYDYRPLNKEGLITGSTARQCTTRLSQPHHINDRDRTLMKTKTNAQEGKVSPTDFAQQRSAPFGHRHTNNHLLVDVNTQINRNPTSDYYSTHHPPSRFGQTHNDGRSDAEAFEDYGQSRRQSAQIDIYAHRAARQPLFDATHEKRPWRDNVRRHRPEVHFQGHFSHEAGPLNSGFRHEDYAYTQLPSSDVHRPPPGQNDVETNNTLHPDLGQQAFTRSDLTILRDDFRIFANAIKQGFTLPKRTLETFNGDPLLYHEFMTNFDTNIVKHVTDSEIMLGYLIDHCEGPARASIKSCVAIKPPLRGYEEARWILFFNFGQMFIVVRAHIKNLTSGKQINENDSSALFSLSVAMRNAEILLREWGRGSQLDNEDTLLQIFKRLPSSIQNQFNDRAYEMNCRGLEVNFSDLASLVHRASAKSKTIFGQHFSSREKGSKAHGGGTRFGASTFSTDVNQDGIETDESSESTDVKVNTAVTSGTCPLCKEAPHPFWRCRRFIDLSISDRFDFTKSHKLCFNCLRTGHIAHDCQSKSRCKKCANSHHSLLHYGPPSPEATVNHVISQIEPIGSNSIHSSGHRPQVRLQVVPVMVRTSVNDRCFQTYAFLDSGSNSTMCTFRLLHELGLQPTEGVCTIKTINGEKQHKGARVSLHVSGLQGESTIDLPRVLAIDELPDVSSSIITRKDCNTYNHLDGKNIVSLPHNNIDLLIGADVLTAHRIDQYYPGFEGDPVLVHTGLGWCFMGVDRGGGSTSQPMEIHHKSVSFQNTEITKQFMRAFDIDFEDNNLLQDGPSVQDRRALEIMDATCSRIGKHFVVGLPWKHDEVMLPNNKLLAKQRLNQLRKKLEANPSIYAAYIGKINDYISSGHAELVSPTQPTTAGKTWYLPHHCTKGKFRVVFDCGAKCKGISLNDELLSGPDHTNKLLDVLLKFRLEKYALVGDIKSMFHQVFVPTKDRDAFRFLWWSDGKLDKEPDTYRMCVHLFGATSSPSCAGYALRRTAFENTPHLPQPIVNTVLENVYVDDCLKSFSTIAECKEAVGQLKCLLKSGGFELTKFMSNSKDVLHDIPRDDLAPCMQTYVLGESSTSKTLGVQWNPQTDNFEFHSTIEDRPLTRRGMLSMISQVYDPFGFIQPFVLPMKRLLQQLCTQQLGWDDVVSNESSSCWNKWLAMLPNLNSIVLPRCFNPFDKVVSAELHCFSDASQLVGYGAVCYLRLRDACRNIQCKFVLGKSKVNPLKPITVPRLELTSAVLAVKLSLQVIPCISSYNVTSVIFWTDSSAVLRYIANESTRYKTFVCNRVAFIQCHSSVNQWRHVPGGNNPADLASRGAFPNQLEDCSIWFNGPGFLWQEDSTWRTSSKEELDPAAVEEDPELRRQDNTISFAFDSRFHYPCFSELWIRYSSWLRLQKAISWLTRFKVFIKQHKVLEDRHYLTPDDLSQAVFDIVKLVQRESFPFMNYVKYSEDTRIDSAKYAGVPNSLRKLSPFVHDGVLRVGGRIQRSQLSFDTKHPIILPSSHAVTELIVNHYHKKEGHSGTLHVLAAIRSKFWIIRGQASVRRVLSGCMHCRINQKRSIQQIMAPLPAFRLEPGKRPFSVVGVDYMGPLTVKNGRNQLKRYGCVFSCLATRAVHIEVSHSLDTSGFINALRRFTCRRGNPIKIISDNGGSFVGAEREIKDCIQTWNKNKINSVLLQEGISWSFNPPYASHQGGIWERMIRSIRRILLSLSAERTVTDDALNTFMTEVERILNNRPISATSDDPKDLSVLTPNSLLIGQLAEDLPPGEFIKADGYRRSWRATQWLADEFWKRWIDHYVPLLQKRQKWLKPTRMVKKGDLILLLDPALKGTRGYWPRGLIEEIYPDRDGVVRRVQVKTANGTYYRDIRKLCLLEGSCSKIRDKMASTEDDENN